MSKTWSEANNTTKPQDFTNKEKPIRLTHNAMGTGPYKLVSREVDVKTEYTANENWWNKENKVGNVNHIIYTPISQTRRVCPALCQVKLTLCT